MNLNQWTNRRDICTEFISGNQKNENDKADTHWLLLVAE
jgi:hypothetical protein